VRGKLTNTKAVGSVKEKLVPGSRISADSNFFLYWKSMATFSYNLAVINSASTNVGYGHL
jgi:hypothetical protein